MENSIAALKAHVTKLSANPEFIHHPWFVEWHLEIVARIALELAGHHPEADRELVEVMAWMHDYGKILDFDDQYAEELADRGSDQLVTLGFEPAFARTVADYVKWMDRKLEVDLHDAPIEVQIVSSADGCSHITGPFMYLYWYENAQKPFAELMAGNRRKTQQDWDRKVVLPEARQAFQRYYQATMMQNGELPERFLA